MIVTFVFALLVYLIVGACLAPLIATRGLRRIDPLTESSTLGFRLLVLPGVVLLWPVLVLKWSRS